MLPHLPPPRAPPRGWGFGGCSRVSYCLRGVPRTLKREHREGPSLGIGVFQAREAHPLQAPIKGEHSLRRTLRSADVNCYTPQTRCYFSAEKWALWILLHPCVRLLSNLDSFSAFEETGNFRLRERADKRSWRLAFKYFEEKYFRECEEIMTCHAQNAHIPSCPLFSS